MGSGGRNESNSHQLTPIGQKKIIHELGLHHVYKERIKHFWAQEGEMNLQPSGRSNQEKKIFHELDVHNV